MTAWLPSWLSAVNWSVPPRMLSVPPKFCGAVNSTVLNPPKMEPLLSPITTALPAPVTTFAVETWR